MTNHHVISSEIVQNKEEIKIKYENKQNNLTIRLDPEERIILCLMEALKIDITIVEIIQKEKIKLDDSYFLYPDTDLGSYDQLLGKEIQIIQFPNGNNLSLSNGIILELAKEEDNFENNTENLFYHNAPTQEGSSGSPIVLKGQNTVLAIHKGTLKNKATNIGIFIQEAIHIIEGFQRDGKGKEYYSNGNLKYEGNFKNDEYDGRGKYYFENGEYYEGDFEKGKKIGSGYIYKEGQIIKEVKYDKDEMIEEKVLNNEEIEDENNNENNNENDNSMNNNGNNFINKMFENFATFVKNNFNWKCIGCGHSIQSHEPVEFGVLKCRECEDNGFCKLFFLNK